METIEMFFWGLVNFAINFWWIVGGFLVFTLGSALIERLTTRRKEGKRTARVAQVRKRRQDRKLILQRMKRRLDLAEKQEL